MDAVTLDLGEAVDMAAALLPFTSPDNPRLSLQGAMIGQWPTGDLAAAATDSESAAVFAVSTGIIEGSFAHPVQGIWLPRTLLRWLASYKMPSKRRRGRNDAEEARHTVNFRTVCHPAGGSRPAVVAAVMADGVAAHTGHFDADLRGTTFPEMAAVARQFQVESRVAYPTLDPVKVEAVARWARQRRRTLGGRRPEHERLVFAPRAGDGAVVTCGPLMVALPSGGEGR